MAMVCAQRRAQLFLEFILEMALVLISTVLPVFLLRTVGRLLERIRIQMIAEVVLEVIEVFVDPRLIEEVGLATQKTTGR